MNDDMDPAGEIARLEDEIERAADVAEGCRKFIFAAKAAIGAGGLILAGMLLGVLGGDAILLLAALSGIIGGIVVFGSNASTRRQALATVADAEARRAALIDAMALRMVPANAGVLRLH